MCLLKNLFYGIQQLDWRNRCHGLTVVSKVILLVRALIGAHIGALFKKRLNGLHLSKRCHVLEGFKASTAFENALFEFVDSTNLKFLHVNDILTVGLSPLSTLHCCCLARLPNDCVL